MWDHIRLYRCNHAVLLLLSTLRVRKNASWLPCCCKSHHSTCKAVNYTTQNKELCWQIPPQTHTHTHKKTSLHPSSQNLPSLPSGCGSLSCSLTQIFEIPLMHKRLNMTEKRGKDNSGKQRGWEKRREQTQLSKDLNANPKGVYCILKVSDFLSFKSSLMD